VHTIAKITPADYPDLLAAVDAGVPQRELALRYDCAPSLVARHVARAKRARALGDRREEPDLGLTAVPGNGSMREILEGRLRDPRTSARDLASLANAIARLDSEVAEMGDDRMFCFRQGTLAIEPIREGKLRLWRRTAAGWDQTDNYSPADLASVLTNELNALAKEPLLEKEKEIPEGVRLIYPRKPAEPDS
jgi:hypothetical protein